ncbi:MAG: glycosyltransferase [Gemmataceae bacterium]|nr:glycosyltransferase [Gemmataceae bacterium]MCI0741224.1 glycosyltransferase [Gemmataceae bacterium]
MLAPILLFAYKRPRHTLRLLESLAANPPAVRSRLVVYCDGPKEAAEEAAVADVRRIVRSRRWCAQLDIVERERNLGLADSIVAGVSETLRDHEAVIVLEDDLELSPHFLDFMNAALERYRDEERVWQVSGYMFPLNKARGSRSAFFLPIISTWGWATWRRAWRYLDRAGSGFAELAADSGLRHEFDLGGSYPFFSVLESQQRGLVDSWGALWYLTVFQRRGLTLFPVRSLVRNHGWDGSGTHCGKDGHYDTDLAPDSVHQFPPHVNSSREMVWALQHFFRRRFSPPAQPWAGRLARWWQRWWGRVTSFSGD